MRPDKLSQYRNPVSEMPEHHPHNADQNEVSTAFRPGTGRTIKISASVFLAVLFVAFLVVHFLKSSSSSELASASKASASAKPRVDVITVSAAGAARPLTLPGEAAAWYESTIYA